MDNSYGAKIREERRDFIREQTEAEAQRKARTARPEITPTSQQPVARPMTPYLPETEEEGPLGEIMRASPAGVQTAYERMPMEERPIELIRGTERTYWSPGTRQEYGDIRTAMTGFQPRPEAERRDIATTTGMTPYQTASLGLKAEELGFKQSQAELDYITKGLEARFASMADIGQQPTQDQITMQTGVLKNEWIKANYSPKEAKSLIARNPVELRQNKRTGEMRWYNEYGKPIKAETVAAAEADIEQSFVTSPSTFDTRAEIAPVSKISAHDSVQKTAEQRAKVAEKLRRIYEEENLPPIIGEESIRRFMEAWSKREKSPYVEAPERLKGYAGSRY